MNDVEWRWLNFVFLFVSLVSVAIFNSFGHLIQHRTNLTKLGKMEFSVCLERTWDKEKSLSPRRESNPWPFVHWSGALATELLGQSWQARSYLLGSLNSDFFFVPRPWQTKNIQRLNPLPSLIIQRIQTFSCGTVYNSSNHSRSNLR